MSNYDAVSRTNYFRVRDIDAFLAELQKYGITTTSATTPHRGDLVLDQDPSNKPSGAISLSAYDSFPDVEIRVEDVLVDLGLEPDDPTVATEYRHTSFEALVAAHLVETDVAVFISTGNEKTRYIGGYALAINSSGETRTVLLDDIYELAKEIATEGTAVTLAEY